MLLLSRFRRVRLVVTPWTAASQVPPSMGFFQARVLEWVAVARTLHVHPGAPSSSASPTAPPGGCAGSIPTAAHSPVA